MQPVAFDLAVTRGDTPTLAFRFSRQSGLDRVPYDFGGDRIDLEITYPGGSILKNTADGTLVQTSSAAGLALAWTATDAESSGLPLGAVALYRLTRTSALTARTTLVTGRVLGLGVGAAGIGNITLDILVNDGVLVLAVASGPIIDAIANTSALFAQILGGADANHNTLKKLGDLISALAANPATGKATDLDMTGIPTTLPGKAGVLWSNGGVLQVS